MNYSLTINKRQEMEEVINYYAHRNIEKMSFIDKSMYYYLNPSIKNYITHKL